MFDGPISVPPIKCQGIKTKLIPNILNNIERNPNGLWIEPFLGSGVVVLNVLPKRALLSDINPHIIKFYQAIKDKKINSHIVRTFLEHEGKILSQEGKEYYYSVRDRFNQTENPLDFLFLNRSCFNGLIRFNQQGKFNVPFGHKPQKFSPSYITRIVNQVKKFSNAIESSDWIFECKDYKDIIKKADIKDFIYCDPPYIGRHVEYYQNWDEQSEILLYQILKNTKSKFMLSTWHSNQHRENKFLQILWNEFTVSTQEHFYHIGAYEDNRKPMLEALVTNYIR